MGRLGTAVYVFGASGPAYGSYEVSFDGNAQNKSAYAPTNATEPFLLFNTSGLPQTTHSLKVTNLGSTAASEGTSLLLDWIHLTADFGAPGYVPFLPITSRNCVSLYRPFPRAEIKSTIIEETDPALKFTGKWGHNTNPSFSGGGTTFTQEDNASVSLTFRGTFTTPPTLFISHLIHIYTYRIRNLRIRRHEREPRFIHRQHRQHHHRPIPRHRRLRSNIHPSRHLRTNHSRIKFLHGRIRRQRTYHQDSQ